MNIIRSTIFHTPQNAFHHADALIALADGALAIEDGRIVRCGDYKEIANAWPDAPVRDLRGGCIVPGFVDTHVHFPQVRILGGLGYSLLDWLQQLTLPEEASLADTARAAILAKEFIHALVSHGTTTALVFGSHFSEATAALFLAAEAVGLRVTSGLVMADRLLLHELHQTPVAAYEASRALIERFHNRGRLRYAVTPRFALSASEAMLDAAATLVREDPSLFFTTHMNENLAEIEEVNRLFPHAGDYFGVYERAGLAGPNAVFAHDVHVTESELRRLSASGSSVAHCPSSNAALGSGVFPLARHLAHGVRFALGTDVGAGTGFGIAKEALQCYLQQRVAVHPVAVTPAQMLYLSTRAGAEALGLSDETGDFAPGKAADFVYLQAPAGSVLEGVLTQAESPECMLAALFTMAGAESVIEVQVAGEVVHS